MEERAFVEVRVSTEEEIPIETAFPMEEGISATVFLLELD